ncbi:glycoside hydrolase family 18 protein [Aspergillus lucknowensis]|uniref:chitinase n=1 Tax=Aspergillus lucknowensis TaxID=176173 RepID=A0ABR4LIU3_9EURO
MSFMRRILSLLGGLAVLEGVYAALDLSSNSTVAVYWGQNSFRGTGNLAQQRLGYYCDDPNIDVIILAFLMTINGPGGAPEVDFASSSEKCETFPGTNLKNCPEIGEDITTCQSKGKTILLSIGGATYSEGGFTSTSAAEAGADLIWTTFGPEQAGGRATDTAANAHRPFGSAVLDGFDFDFEAAVSNMGTFATRLRSLADADTSRTYYLTAAPQCPFPDAADKDILNTDASAAIDAVWVQFYNNYCGVNAFTPSSSSGQPAAQNNFNFETWDKWALTESKNKNVRVYLGVPANTGAASTGYVPIGSLEPVIAYSKQFESFGGVMMWDVTQAYGNQGFLPGVKSALGKAGGGAGVQQAPQEDEQTPTLTPTPVAVPQEETQQETQEQTQGETQEETQEETQGETQEETQQETQGETQGPQQSEAEPQQETPVAVTPQASGAPQGSDSQGNQDQGDGQPGQPMNLIPSIMDPNDDLDWVEI